MLGLFCSWTFWSIERLSTCSKPTSDRTGIWAYFSKKLWRKLWKMAVKGCSHPCVFIVGLTSSLRSWLSYYLLWSRGIHWKLSLPVPGPRSKRLGCLLFLFFVWTIAIMKRSSTTLWVRDPERSKKLHTARKRSQATRLLQPSYLRHQRYEWVMWTSTPKVSYVNQTTDRRGSVREAMPNFKIMSQ